jgi:C-terminal processing protease CtpA/Prc
MQAGVHTHPKYLRAADQTRQRHNFQKMAASQQIGRLLPAMSFFQDREAHLSETSLRNAYAQETFYPNEGAQFEVRNNDGVERCGVGLLLLPDSDGAVRVMGLAPGSPAERCGRIQKGDILAEVDGVVVYKQPLDTFGERISGPMYSHVELVFYGNEEKSFKYRVQLQRLANLQAQTTIPEPQFAERRSYEDAEGLHHHVSPNKQPSFVGGEGGVGIMFCSEPNGCFVVADLVPDGPAQLSGGIQPGDTITEIDGNQVTAYMQHLSCIIVYALAEYMPHAFFLTGYVWHRLPRSPPV